MLIKTFMLHMDYRLIKKKEVEIKQIIKNQGIGALKIL